MLQTTIDWFTYSLLNIDPQKALGVILNFFLYDTIKILGLLFIMISIIGFARSFLPEEKVRRWIGKGSILSYFGASTFGAITPFCSCSSIPFFFSFLKMGIPLGVVFSFLITSPIVNEYLVVLMLGFFGLKVTIVYVASGIAIGVIAGFVLGKLNLEKHISSDFKPKCSCEKESQLEVKTDFATLKKRAIYGLNEALSIIKKLWKWILLGVGLGAIIHNYVPREFFESVINNTGVFAVPLSTLLGIPMYGSCASIVPIAVVLFNKGVPLGVALSFMMATSALSLPEAILLKRAMRLKLILIFFGITAFAIISIGYLIDFLF